MNQTENRIPVFIDSCLWNLLFETKICLASEFPKDEFTLFVTKEVYSFEMTAIPPIKADLKAYIDEQMQKAEVRVDSFFGFVSYKSDVASRVGGFGEGRWVTYNEGELIKLFQVESNRQRKNGLFNNEADASLAVRACSGGVVLTTESRNKSGPLKRALKRGGRIAFLDSGIQPMSLKNIVLNAFKEALNDRSK